ncbi:nebulette isoform X1 [Parus major]|uniref:nebulette isoform X1 n=2 Tax=Parus major TaxID=9157 RepID=UPI00077116BF|nr:nebulette isoform X1 [Parus major]XP_015473394.1 nebulette isoform X1 [Parus major]XP_015473395.1 nebulette isoform X1 [Parus major]XP_015473396.1 nebulette isoform X1 [Parus major]XP_015473399.1 nebulette isoform X1 [Parus major]XP_015473401.1 nebulette isoform X1 [Parus major]XP_033367505.1 nebulette isoform X1 [Parus major]
MRMSAIQDLREDENEDWEEEEKVFLKPVIEDRNMELARKCSELISDIHYKEEFKKSKGKCIFVPDTPQLKHVKSLGAFISEVKYKGDAKKDLSNSLYQQMPATIDSVFAKELMHLQSKVLYKQKHDAEKGFSDYARMREPPDVKHAMEVSKHQSDVSYKKDVQDTHRYTEVLNRPDIKKATEITKIISDATYKKGRGELNKESAVLGRPDFEHAKGVSKLLSQVKYKEKFSKEMKSHQYNPLDSASFKQAQIASTLASDVNYKKDLESLHDPASDLPNLLHLNHALNISKTQSDVKYKENYEKSKGRSMLEFVDTPMYQVSKEAQKMQSEKMYRRDFEEGIKGRPSLDLDKTPEFLHIKQVTNLLKEKEYRKDLEEGMKGKGMTVFEDTPDLIRVKNAAQILNERQYKKDLETEIKGKGMEVGPDTPEIRRAKKASEIASMKEYKKDLENEIKGKGMEVSTDTLDIQRAKKASEIVSQKMYKDEAEKMLCNYSAVPDTPEMERIRSTQKNISSVFYKKEVGAGTAVKDTPEIERVKKNQQNISSIKYKEEIRRATAISDPPELRRVKENQKNISNVQYKEQLCKATPMSVTPEMERVKRNQENVSMVHYREQPGKATAVSVTPEIERVRKNQDNISSVKYSSDQRQMKGRRSVLLDTPELRHVKETQNNISMVKYHEDFEKTKGRGFTPVVDDPITERVRKNTQIVSDAAYKGVHPHIVEMDRRPGIIVDLKVWRTDPGSIFDIDPLEDNIQSRSLHMLSERASRYTKQYLHSTSLGDYKSDGSDTNPTFSYCSEITRPSDEGAPVLPGAYQQSQTQGYGYMHQTSMSSMRSMHSQPHSASLRTYRAMYDYSAQDEDEVSFRDGDYIINVQPIDDGWMYGTVQRTGKTGMLPANYIEFVN